MTDTSKMPAYECHKKVHALEIASVGNYKTNPVLGDLVRTLTFVDGTTRTVKEELFRRYIPKPGDFYVVYENDYESFSPREVFLGGYKLFDDRTFADIKQGLIRPLRSCLADTNLGDTAIISVSNPSGESK